MTAPLPDDLVRAMLEERAGRVSPDAEREAMTAFRAAVRGAPDGAGGFAVLPQALSSRDARLPWGLAAFGMVAVVAIALLGGRLSSTNVAVGSAPAVAGSDVPASLPAPGIASSSAPTQIADELALEQLLASGKMRGQVLVIDGRLVTASCPYGTSPSSCPTFILGRPGLRVRVSDDPLIADDALSAVDSGPTQPMAFRVRDDGSLDFLGVLGSAPDAPLSVDRLIDTTIPLGRLVAVEGWLTDASPSCGAPSGAGLCNAPIVLSGGAPPAEGTSPARRWLDVEVAPGAARPEGPSRELATFILRRADATWRLEGNYAAHVPVVTARPSPTADVGDLTADQVRSGLADGSLTGRVIVIDGALEMMQVPCPKPGACTVGTLPKLAGVPIRVDPAIEASVANHVPAGPHVFMGDGVGLTYLGTMTGPVDPPMSVAQLWALSPAVDETGIRFVEGIVGPIPCVGCPTSPTMLPGLWLSGTNGSKAAAVAVSVPETIEAPPSLDRYLVRSSFGSPCDGTTPPPGVVLDCTPEYRWAIVAAVGEEPILRVSRP